MCIVATCDGKEIKVDHKSSLNVTFDRKQSSIKDRYPAGTVATLTCIDDNSYIIEGSKSTVCQKDGSWNIYEDFTRLNCGMFMIIVE